MLMSEVQGMIEKSCDDDEYGDIMSMLDEYLPNPTFSEVLAMAHYLGCHVSDAVFEYEQGTGWTYVEAWDNESNTSAIHTLDR